MIYVFVLITHNIVIINRKLIHIRLIQFNLIQQVMNLHQKKILGKSDWEYSYSASAYKWGEVRIMSLFVYFNNQSHHKVCHSFIALPWKDAQYNVFQDIHRKWSGRLTQRRPNNSQERIKWEIITLFILIECLVVLGKEKNPGKRVCCFSCN